MAVGGMSCSRVTGRGASDTALIIDPSAPLSCRATRRFARVNGGSAICISGAAYLVQAPPLAADGATQIGSRTA